VCPPFVVLDGGRGFGLRRASLDAGGGHEGRGEVEGVDEAKFELSADLAGGDPRE
jgi:hypothetical protein